MLTKIKRYKSYDSKMVPDLIALYAANIENAYITAGVTDYTAKECVDHAIPFVLSVFNSKDAISKSGEMEVHFDTTL